MIVGFISLMVSIYNAVAEFLNPIYTLFTTIFTGIVTQLKLFVQLFKQIINGDFAGIFDTLGMMWENMKRTAIGVFDSIIQYAKNLLSFLNPVASIIGKMMGLDIASIKMTTSANLSMAGASARTGNVTINQTNQLLAGTPAQQANFVQDATQQAADSMFRATLHTEYAT
jgi:phage-related protein